MKRSKLNKAITICLTIALGIFAFPFPSKAVEPSLKLEITPMVVAGKDHTVALRSDGTVWTWGNNTHGQLGDGNDMIRNKPKQVKELPEIASIAADGYNTVALTRDGKVYTWGKNDYGQLGIGQDSNQLPYSKKPVEVENLSDITKIATSGYHMIALNKNGNIYAWGYNDKGQLGLNPDSTPSSNIPTEVPNVANVKSIAAGVKHSAILTNANDIYIWGDNSFGQFGNGSTSPDYSYTPAKQDNLNNVISIAASGYNMAALDENGNLHTWGFNLYGQIGNASTGSQVTTPYNVTSNINKVEVSGNHMLTLDNNGTVYAWGYNSFGQLGDGTKTNKTSPIKVNDLNDITSIAIGGGHSIAINKDGYVYAWGKNSQGTLGNGTFNNSTIPVQVVDETGKGYFNLNVPDTRDVSISTKASIPTPTYTINIPATVDVGELTMKAEDDPDRYKMIPISITASNVKNLFGKIQIAANISSKNSFQLKDEANALDYSIYSEDDFLLVNGDPIAKFIGNGTSIGNIVIDQSQINRDGSYSDTLTFSIQLQKTDGTVITDLSSITYE